jgi:cardiolipin synthase A/B
VLVRTKGARAIWTACLVAALALLVPRQAPAPVAAAAPAVQLIGPGRAGAPLVSLIDGARQRVLVEAFALSDSSVIAALQAAQRRGVDVRVMLDPRGLSSAATLRALQSAGIRTRAPNPTYALTHLDEVVVDATDVVVLTTALTADALGRSGRGYMVIDGNRPDVVQAASIFYDDWLRRAVNVSDHHNLVLLPDEAARVANLIDQAGARLELYTSDLSDPGVIASLNSVRERGVVVRVLTPPGSNNAGLRRLVGRAGQVRFRDDGAGTLLVSDRHTVLLGSMDLSASTLTAHRDLAIVLSDHSISAPVDGFFFSEFARGSVLKLPRPHKAHRAHTVAGAPKVSVDIVPSVVRVGSASAITVTTVPRARVDVAIRYPAGSKPAAGTSGARGHAGKRGLFVYRWIPAGRIRAGEARVLVVVHSRGTVARYTRRFTVAG